MEKRQRLIFVHILESLAIAVLAGVIVAVLQWFLSDEFSSLADGLASLGQHWIGGLIIFVLACLGISFPNGFISTVRSLKWLLKCPPVHFGILAKVVIGAVVYLLLILAHPSTTLTLDAYSIGFLGGFCALGLIAGHILACLVKKLRRHAKTIISLQTEKQRLDAWLADDQPIESETESRFPAQSAVARRILTKLLSQPIQESGVLPSIALVGPYGSGKTSICNLVEDIYHKEKKKDNLPDLLLCRFEAWQFLSAEAAVKNLIEVSANSILKLIDISELWRIPEKYIEAVKASGNWWSSICAVLFGGSDDPEEIASIIGDTLVRLNVRLIIFVDDFDRIEEDAFATQQAVAKALNQLQNIPNIQYVISVGPTIDIGRKSGIAKRSWDLLKLTRFQELVPKIDQEKVISLVRRHRDDVLNDSSCYFPWAERSKGEGDPLVWYTQFRHLLSSLGFCGKLLGLVQTPRVLKCVLRESQTSWKGGLKGEIDWYDLILANALKAAEPAVFEWIARDRYVFIEEPNPRMREPESEENKRYAKELEQQLKERVEGKDPIRYEIVKEAVCGLFPFFKDKLDASMISYMTNSPVSQWSQKISLRPNHGSDYLERFFAGEVPEGDIPDQPTLQYIRRITQEGFNVNAFESLYLDSQEKLKGSFNKMVQFSELIPQRLAYKICDTILYWIADTEHAEVWTEPESFIGDILPKVFNIIDYAGGRQGTSRKDDEVVNEREEWLIRAVQLYTCKAPILAVAIVEGAKKYKGAEKLPDVFLKRFEAEFVQNKVQDRRRLLPSLSISRFALAWLMDDIRKYPGYKDIKASFTQKILAEAENESGVDLKERIIFSLVTTTTPARSGEIRPEEHKFSVEKGKNEQKYDITSITDALKRWYAVKWSDEIAKRAFSRLKQAYKVG